MAQNPVLDPGSHDVEELRAPLERILETLDQPYSPRHDALEGFQIASDD